MVEELSEEQRIVIHGNFEILNTLIENPQKLLSCALCGINGQRKILGWLIPFGSNLFVHTNCALWSDEVFDNSEGMILNFYFSYDKARYSKCFNCSRLGASISC